MICTVSSLGSPLPPGRWCDAFSVTSAAPAVPATAKPTTTAVVEKSTRIFIDISEFLPVACCSVDTRCHGVARSEEHTSELQSLMRISYAVFCLKKKKPKNNKQRVCMSLTKAKKKNNTKDNHMT